ncbi:MAG: ABC transporter ATP-binding protein [Proteobacteria bacterium]|nr:ABC transporter ATP-binding protein [Pseudomonadota bacterium]
MGKTVLSIENIVKKFGNVAAVNGVSLTIQDGDFFALLGPSGCGKTTLLRMLGGFDSPTSGHIFMDGIDITDVPPNKRQINMLFQSYAVFPHMNVEDNVAYGLRMEKRPTTEINQRVQEALALVRMEEFAKRPPDKLSGGQRQRVALARALIKKPRILLLDEPLSALDAKLRGAMQTELVRLQQTVGITFIIVTHDQDEALSMATRIAVMDEGSFCQVDAPRVLYEAPSSRFVADFIGRMNMHECIVIAEQDNGYCINAGGDMGEISVRHAPLPGVRAGDKIYYGVRPEKVIFSKDKPADNVGNAVVLENYSYHGDETLLYCRSQDGTLWTCTLTNDRRNFTPVNVGELGWLTWAADNMILLAK